MNVKGLQNWQKNLDCMFDAANKAAQPLFADDMYWQATHTSRSREQFPRQ